MLNRKFNVFPLNNPKLLDASGEAFLSNTAPSVSLDEISIKNKDTDTLDVEINLCLTQNVKEAMDRNWWFFQNSPRNSKYRIRLLTCFGASNSVALDFVAQRMNEYQCDMMSTRGAAGALSFINNMNQYQVGPTKISGLLNPEGPFAIGALTRKMKGSQSGILTYSDETSLGDIIVHDIPVLPSIEKSKDGTPNVSLSEGLGKAFLSSIKFNIPSDKISDTLSVYAFVYYDSTDSLQEKSITYPAQTISGFIDTRAMLGDKVEFSTQTKNRSADEPGNLKNIGPVDGEFLSDARSTTRIDQSNIAAKINKKTLDYLLEELGENENQKPVTKIIKNHNDFSNLWITRSDKDSKRFMFSFDLRSFLLKESSFPVLYSKDQIARELLQGGELIADFETASVKYICVKRRQVEFESYTSDNDLGTQTRNKEISPNYIFPEEIVTIPSRIDDIFLEINQRSNENVAFYQGVDTCSDNRKTQSLSKFQYGTKVSVNDPSLLFLKRVMADLNDMTKQVENVYDTIKNSPQIRVNEEIPPGSINISGRGLINLNGTKRIVPLTLIGLGQVTADEVISDVIRKYVSYAEKFELIGPSLVEDSLETEVGGTLYSLANSSKVEDMLQIVSSIEKLSFSIERVLKAELPKGISNEGNTDPSDLEQRGFLQTKFSLLEKEHFFSEVIEYGTLYQTGYDYIAADYNTSALGLPEYSRASFQSRFLEEFNKYFGEYPDDGQPSRIIDSTEGTYGNSTLRYYTPKLIKIFGKDTINQPTYLNQDSNSANYDIDQYASLFLDICKLKKQKDINSPFLAIEKQDMGSSLEEALMRENCVITDSISPEFETYEIGKKKRKPAGKQKKITINTKNNFEVSPDLFQTFLGGAADKSDDTKDYFKVSDSPFKPKNFGIVSATDKSANKDPKKALPPTKLMFNILADLQINPIENDEVMYEKETFNSLINASKNIEITAKNVKSIIEGDLAEIPNQFKSMFVIANVAQQMSLGSGFDATRFMLKDQDVSTIDKVITNIYAGDSFPPYKNAKDPMKVYAKFLTFWMNYKQIAVIEYLSGFDDLQSNGVSLRSDSTDKRALPVWKKFTVDFYRDNADRKFLCRIRNLSQNDLETTTNIPVDYVDLLDLPIYNKYFILAPEEG